MRQLFAMIFSTAILFSMASPTLADNYFVVEKQPTVQHKTKHINGIPDTVLKSTINAYVMALKQHDVHNKHMLTIVDFDRPSYERRLWVIDLNNDHIIMNIHVAQGRNSGKVYAKYFSNDPGSHASSIGIFTTVGDEYHGNYGKSLRLKGLETGINNNAFYRGIVIHSEWDVTPKFIKAMGYAGRTWGCFAVNPDHIDRLIELLEDGSVFYVYAAPEKNDSLVDHPLSPDAQKLYNKIVEVNSNPITRFFEDL